MCDQDLLLFHMDCITVHRCNPYQEAAKKKARAERFGLPKSKEELAKEEREKAAALAAELAEKKRIRGERFGTLSEADKVLRHLLAVFEYVRTDAATLPGPGGRGEGRGRGQVAGCHLLWCSTAVAVRSNTGVN